MKIHTMKLTTLALAGLMLTGGTTGFARAAAAAAQEKDKKKSEQKTRPRTTGTTTAAAPPLTDGAGQPVTTAGERLEPDDTSAPPRADVPEATLANRRETLSEEESAVVPYYNNFMASYRLGPEDVISVTVFNLDRYSKAGITIPPDAVISHPLIPEGVFVGGKTTKQVADEITKKLDEYVIDPKVTVSLDKAQSAVFWVVGDVAQPGIRPMSRRLSVTEALALSGGVLDTGNKKKVMVMRRQANGFLQPTIIDVAAIEKGRMPDNYFLNPGDQIIVPGNRMKNVQKILSLLPVVSFFRIFTGGF
ncbi:MAG: polysaccharide biosynthesis/export protein [Pyrinomonadaceae bacterium]|nr:polysaccharide biosynthesis/export protein [Pyrinomonadaceae bacterium]